MAGCYGDVLWDASFVVRGNNELIAASIITNYQDQPLLAFTVTNPLHQGQGLAEMLISCSINKLVEGKYKFLSLVVTKSNFPALSLYKKLNFLPE